MGAQNTPNERERERFEAFIRSKNGGPVRNDKGGYLNAYIDAMWAAWQAAKADAAGQQPKWQPPHPGLVAFVKAAINLLAAVDENHGTKPYPLKYGVPYGAVNDLRAAVGILPDDHKAADEPMLNGLTRAETEATASVAGLTPKPCIACGFPDTTGHECVTPPSVGNSTPTPDLPPLPEHPAGSHTVDEVVHDGYTITREHDAYSADQLRAYAAPIAAERDRLREEVVSGFYEDRKPVFRQGAPVHELESAVTADECTGYVDKIDALRILNAELAGALDALLVASVRQPPFETGQPLKTTGGMRSIGRVNVLAASSPRWAMTDEPLMVADTPVRRHEVRAIAAYRAAHPDGPLWQELDHSTRMLWLRHVDNEVKP